MAKPGEVERKWYVVDATGKVLGRLASQIAAVLRGKNKPSYTPNVDTGDFVIVINAEKIVLTGKKLELKMYKTYSGYPGGLKETSYEKILAEKPELAIKRAVKGMLPNTPMGRDMLLKLKIFVGPEHNHQAQMPVELKLEV
jgi:large subunit ribosomal protein L13